MEEIEEVSANGLRYCAKEDTYVGQDLKAITGNAFVCTVLWMRFCILVANFIFLGSQKFI
jgi:hypothetical protein